MYADPARIRKHVVKLRFSDEEHALIQALVNYTGEQTATLLRDLALERAMEIVSPSGGADEAALSARISA